MSAMTHGVSSSFIDSVLWIKILHVFDYQEIISNEKSDAVSTSWWDYKVLDHRILKVED